MLRAFLFTVFLLSHSLPLLGQGKIAGVRINEIIRELSDTYKIRTEYIDATKKLSQDVRVVSYNSSRKELSKLAAVILEAKKDGITDKAKLETLQRDYTAKLAETSSLESIVKKFLHEETRSLNIKRIEKLEKSADQIIEKIKEIGRAAGYEMILDIGGKTNTGLPFLLYSNKIVDITDEVKSYFELVPAEKALAGGEDSLEKSMESSEMPILSDHDSPLLDLSEINKEAEKVIPKKDDAKLRTIDSVIIDDVGPNPLEDTAPSFPQIEKERN